MEFVALAPPESKRLTTRCSDATYNLSGRAACAGKMFAQAAR